MRTRNSLRPIANREAERILRATDAFGVLNSIPATLSPSQVENLYRKAEQRLYGDPHRRNREAGSRLRAARRLLKVTDKQKETRRRIWAKPREITFRCQCAVDARGIEEYIRR